MQLDYDKTYCQSKILTKLTNTNIMLKQGDTCVVFVN